MHNNRTPLTIIGLFCFAVVGVALYLQHAKDMLPCPLCVVQRYAFLLAGLLALLAAWAKPAKLWNALALIAALTGLGYAGKHLYVQANPGFACGIDPLEIFLNKIPLSSAIPWLFQADGLCATPDYWLGLSIPQWSVLAFTIVTVTLIYTLLNRK